MLLNFSVDRYFICIFSGVLQATLDWYKIHHQAWMTAWVWVVAVVLVGLQAAITPDHPAERLPHLAEKLQWNSLTICISIQKQIWYVHLLQLTIIGLLNQENC